ncbi:MAG TPA: beta-L-arabinofuranosidase domain-containing protein [Terracidiphilus sp.]|nr:beta-L-arabinofuranosidase domain-containing protein [Terracidiphilus sp.]
MNRRDFVKTAVSVPIAAEVARRSAALEREPAALGANRVASMMPDARFELTLLRVLHGDAPAYTEEFLLADVRPTPERRFTEFSGDLSGRYIGAMAMAAKIYGVETPGLDELVAKTIALQKPDGYFGSAFHFDKPTDLDMALLWGNGRLLVGLLEYQQLRPSAAVLASCRRLGDFLVRIGPMMLSAEMREAFGAKHFASSYICWMQQTEGLAQLYSVTRDERYRKLTEQIAGVIERRPGDHVHGYLTSLRGVMDLYNATGDAQFLRQCETAWQEVADSQDLLITGGVPEGWSPNSHRTEGCAEADWVRLNLALWRSTKNEKYRAMAEHAILNELAFNQYATGDFGHRVYTATGLPAAGAVCAWWCCTLHGLRCFPDIQSAAFQQKDGKLWLDLPVDGQIETPALSAVSESTLARDGAVRIRITAAGGYRAFLGIHKPDWADGMDLRVNGQPQHGSLDQPNPNVDRVWQAGDVVEIRYKMGRQMKPEPDGRVSFWYGPWLLGAPASDNPAYFNELTIENKLLEPIERRNVHREDVSNPFRVPIAAAGFRYAPGEYPDQKGIVQLRAIAEQTSQPTTSWELRFLADPAKG